jgi:hypothetical protein
MKEIVELKEIVANQKTVTTKKLAPLIKAIGQAYANQGEIITNQRNSLKDLNSRYNKVNKKAAKYAALVEEHEKLKNAHNKVKEKLRIANGGKPKQ